MESHGSIARPAGISKRTRQACASCRRRKTKCSGERPVCSHCQQSRHRCVYEPYAITTATTSAPVPDPPLPNSAGQLDSAGDIGDKNDLLNRISTIEKMLQKITRSIPECQNQTPKIPQTTQRQASSLPSPAREGVFYGNAQPFNDSFPYSVADANSNINSPVRSSSISHRPPVEAVSSLVNTYFSRLHNQPYAFFHQASFLERLERGDLPRCLLYAVFAVAVRFTDHLHFHGKIHEASDAYSRRSWFYVMEDYLSVDDNLDLAVIQAVALLALVDYTAGRASSGWLRLGLAVRLSQDLDLMQEPPQFLSPIEYEERRRSFWSIYIIDKLMSCSRSRPPAISDQDCTLQLPCGEEPFQAGRRVKTPTLEQIQSWQGAETASASLFGLTILASSIFGRCVRYVYGTCSAEAVPPWDPKSDYVATNALLLLLESSMGDDEQSAAGSTTARQETPVASRRGSSDENGAGHQIFSQVLFHLSHCLLNHPFLMRLRQRPIAARTPASFVAHAFHISQKHAMNLTDLLTTASSEGLANLESSPYSYCATVAAGIHALAYAAKLHDVQVDGNYDARSYLAKSTQVLERLAGPWPFAARMKNKLDDLETRLDDFADLFNPKCLANELSFESEQFLWSLLDLGSLTKDSAAKTPSSFSFLAGLPSPSQWDFLTDQDGLMAPGPGYDTMVQLDFADVQNVPGL